MEFDGHGSNPFGFGGCQAVGGRFRGKTNRGVGDERMVCGMKGGETRIGSGFRDPVWERVTGRLLGTRLFGRGGAGPVVEMGSRGGEGGRVGGGEVVLAMGEGW